MPALYRLGRGEMSQADSTRVEDGGSAARSGRHSAEASREREARAPEAAHGGLQAAVPRYCVNFPSADRRGEPRRAYERWK